MFVYFFQHNFNKQEYYTFEPVSFVPFEPKLIDLHLLNKKQVCVPNKIILLCFSLNYTLLRADYWFSWLLVVFNSKLVESLKIGMELNPTYKTIKIFNKKKILFIKNVFYIYT